MDKKCTQALGEAKKSSYTRLMDAAIKTELEAFFEEYGEAFAHGILDKACTKLSFPLSISAPDGVQCFGSQEDMCANTQALIEKYASLGVKGVRMSRLNLQCLGPSKHARADATWQLLNEKGGPIVAFDTSYILARTTEGWRIILVITHNEKEKIAALRR